MKNIKLLFTLVLMTITVLGTSCSDWLDDISPRHAIPQSALTDDDLEKAIKWSIRHYGKLYIHFLVVG